MDFNTFDVLIELAARGGRANVDPEIFAEVFHAWNECRTMKVHYYRADDGAAMDLFVEPHILKMRDGVWYIKSRLVSSESTPVIRTLALHRITEVYATGRRFERNTAFETIRDNNEIELFDLPIHSTVKLALRNSAIQYALEYLPPGEFTMQNNEMLLTLQDIEAYRIRNFILLSGGNATVVYPEDLKQEIISFSERNIAANTAQKESGNWIKNLKETFFSKLF